MNNKNEITMEDIKAVFKAKTIVDKWIYADGMTLDDFSEVEYNRMVYDAIKHPEEFDPEGDIDPLI